MTRAALCALALAAAAAAQASRPDVSGKVVAMDHLEARGVTAWIVADQLDGCSLVVARGAAEPEVRLRGRGIRDVLLDSEGKTALLLVGSGTPRLVDAVERVTLEGPVEVRLLQKDLRLLAPVFSRSGDEAILTTPTHVLAIDGQGVVRELFRRDDSKISSVARNASGSLFATARPTSVETVDREGSPVETFEGARAPEFLADDVLAFLRPGKPGSFGRPQTEIAILGAPPGPVEPGFGLVGELSRLRPAGDRVVLFRHAPPQAEPRFWALYWRTGVVRPIEPADRGALRAVRAGPETRAAVVDDSPLLGVEVHAKAEPETPRTGFFRIDENGAEARTLYEESGWDDERHPDEARVHRVLLDRFLEGVQWPLRREPGFEPYFASDDEPLRPGSSIRHLGLDVGARLLHVASGSVAFHAPGSPVWPIWRGGSLWLDVDATLREGESFLGAERYRLVQEVELREGGWLLRVNISYEHVKPYSTSDEPVPLKGSESIGVLEPFADDLPSGHWHTGDPGLAARDLGKGNHVHVGIGGIYRSFNGTPQAGARKLRWYRERLIPALSRSLGPR